MKFFHSMSLSIAQFSFLSGFFPHSPEYAVRSAGTDINAELICRFDGHVMPKTALVTIYEDGSVLLSHGMSMLNVTTLMPLAASPRHVFACIAPPCLLLLCAYSSLHLHWLSFQGYPVYSLWALGDNRQQTLIHLHVCRWSGNGARTVYQGPAGEQPLPCRAGVHEVWAGGSFAAALLAMRQAALVM